MQSDGFCPIVGSVVWAGSAIRYQTVGTGSEFVVFVHGLGGNRGCWHRAPAYFDPKRYTLVFFDLPGFGESSPSADGVHTMERYSLALAAVLEALAIDAPHLVTHSMGSIPALLWSRSHPCRVRSFVVAEGTLGPGSAAMSKRICRLDEESFRRAYSKWLAMVESSLGSEAPDQRARFIASLRTVSPTVLHRVATSCSIWAESAEPSRILANLACPRAYIAGALSREGRLAAASFIGLAMESLVIEGQAHLMMECADRFYSWIESWLVRCAASAAPVRVGPTGCSQR